MKSYVKYGAICAAAVIAIIVFFNSFTVIPTGYTGVRVTFGQISDAVVPNGFNWKAPFGQRIIKVNNKQQDITFADTISAETAERNEVFFSGVTITYSISAEKSAWIYAHVSDYKNNLVSDNLVGSALKSVSKTLTPVDVTNRAIIEPLVKEAVQASLDEKYGEDVVIVNKVIVNNATFDAVYNDKIAQKQQAQMVYETQQIENQTAIELAAAEAEAQVIAAQAKADADILAAQADAEIAKISADSAEYQGQKDAAIMSNLGEMLTKYPDLITYYYVTNWSGDLPTTMLGDNANALFNLN